MDVSAQGFKSAGYQIFRGLLDSSRVARVRATLEQKLDSAIDALKPLGIRTDTGHIGQDIRALLAKPDADKIDRDLRIVMTGHFPLDVRLDRTLWEIPRDPNVQKMLKDALGATTLRMHMPPTARFVLPYNEDAGVPAHQDVSYNQHMTNFLTMWVPLVEIDDRCGGVTVFENGVMPEMPTRSNNHGIWNEGIATQGLEGVDCAPMQPGDVLIFNKLMVHRSMPNVSDRIRFSIDYRFFGETDQSSKHYLDMQSWQVIAPPSLK
jgi:hypothetical protein